MPPVYYQSDSEQEDDPSGSEYGGSVSDGCSSDEDMKMDDADDVSLGEPEGNDGNLPSLADDVDIEVIDVADLHVVAQNSAAVANLADSVQRCETELRELPGDVGEDDGEEKLFDGNMYPPEYYRKGIKDMVVDRYKRKVYAKGTEKQIQNGENQWRQYVSYPVSLLFLRRTQRLVRAPGDSRCFLVPLRPRRFIQRPQSNGQQVLHHGSSRQGLEKLLGTPDLPGNLPVPPLAPGAEDGAKGQTEAVNLEEELAHYLLVLFSAGVRARHNHEDRRNPG